MEQVKTTQAQRMALAAQGFGRPKPATVSSRHITGVADRLGVAQIDSVNVVERAHYLPFYSRLGPYDRALVQRALGQKPRQLFEAWAHEASMVPLDVYHMLRWRRERADSEAWGRMKEVTRRHPELVDEVIGLLAEQGPLTAGQASNHFAERYPVDPPDQWGWNWSPVKTAMEWLFFTGQVAAASRNTSFARLYDLADRVVPPPDGLPSDHLEQITALVDRAASALGVASPATIRDYFRLPLAETKAAIDSLVDQGRLSWAQIEGIDQPWLIHEGASRPRRIQAQALLAPFDPLLFDRDRIAALFGMRFRLEFYVPQAKRVHGYYVMPFLLNQQLVARVDLKAERRAGQLLVKGAFLEPDQEPDRVAQALKEELTTFTGWLGLDSLVSANSPRGDLGPAIFA